LSVTNFVDGGSMKIETLGVLLDYFGPELKTKKQ
jgi:hypothetical protein